MPKIGRNDPCPCGSGKKYKKCCLKRDQAQARLPKIMTASGEEASFRQARYDLLNKSEAIRRLNQAPDFDAEEPEPDQPDELNLVWVEAGESANLMKSIQGVKPPRNVLFPDLGGDGPLRLLGDIKIKGSKLLFNAMGEQRFELGKKRLESLLAGLVRHRLDSVQSISSALAAHGEPQSALFGSGGSKQAIEIDPNDPKFAPLDTGETIQDALRSREFDSIEEANAFLQKAMGDYNNRPQPEMGGLSPVQVGRLLNCEWDDPQGPIVFNQDLSLNDLKNQSPLFSLAYFLIATCDKLGGIKATEAGYLNTTYVLTMAAQILLDEDEDREAFLDRMNGRIREADVFPLFLSRILCQYNGFIDLNKGRFSLTDDGRKMLDHNNVGRFFTQLFWSHFQDLDLDVLDSTGQEFPSIQHTLAFSLFALSTMDHSKWHQPSAFYPRLLLPAAKCEIGGSEDIADWSEDDWWRVIEALDCRLIDPLRDFGLLEDREVEMATSEVDTFKLRPTPFYKKFISFNL